jgi:hypothetical protein
MQTIAAIRKSGDKTSAALTASRQEVERQLSPDEPVARSETITPQAVEDFQGTCRRMCKRPAVPS